MGTSGLENSYVFKGIGQNDGGAFARHTMRAAIATQDLVKSLGR